MLTQLLQPEIQEFIRKHTHADVTKLALQKNPFPHVAWADVLNQVAARQKAESKLPTWFKGDNIIFPSKISVEQTSSETAAQYKSALVSGKSLIDMTGGFGIDDYYFVKNVAQVTHCELNPELSAIAKNNFIALNINNIECTPGDSLETLKSISRTWDWMYIDPSRRNDAKGKVFMLKDCLPNVPDLLDTYFNYTNNVMVKTAPLLDITAGLAELHSVKAIHIVAVNNEVKELLWILQKGFEDQPITIAVNISKTGTEVFESQINNKKEAFYSLPKKYLYEPNAAIMKSGAFNAVSSHYKLHKLHNNTQLYTSNESIDFAGRRFIINKILPYQKADMKQIEGQKMNISTRNFPLSPQEIQKKWKIKDGGYTYAFFTTNLSNEKVVLLCSKA
ncbi:MAG: class I SAM-dependent methyltransferase [Bacteroidota bacterium]